MKAQIGDNHGFVEFTEIDEPIVVLTAKGLYKIEDKDGVLYLEGLVETDSPDLPLQLVSGVTTEKLPEAEPAPEPKAESTEDSDPKEETPAVEEVAAEPPSEEVAESTPEESAISSSS